MPLLDCKILIVGLKSAVISGFVLVYLLNYSVFRSLFEQLDLKKDGKIDTEELTAGLQTMGYYHLTQVPPIPCFPPTWCRRYYGQQG